MCGIGKADGGRGRKSSGDPCNEEPQPDQTMAVGHSMLIIYKHNKHFKLSSNAILKIASGSFSQGLLIAVAPRTFKDGDKH